jgi:hypothetical protein
MPCPLKSPFIKIRRGHARNGFAAPHREHHHGARGSLGGRQLTLNEVTAIAVTEDPVDRRLHVGLTSR